jgi:hypothetical protein
MEIGQTYKIRVKSYTNGAPSDLNSIRWEYSYCSNADDKGIVVGAFVKQRGEEIEFTVEDNDSCGQVIDFYAYIYEPKKEGTCGIYVNPLWRYKGEKKWGTLQKDRNGEDEKFSAARHTYSLKEILSMRDKNGKHKLDERGKQNTKLLNKLSEDKVKWIYENTLKMILSDDDDMERKVIDNFYNGKKALLSFNENSKQSEKLKTYDPFLKYYNNYLEVIKIMLREKTLETKNGKEIIRIFEEKLHTAVFPNFSQDMVSHDYFGLMVGTQTIKVDLDVMQIDVTSYRVMTKMYIGDWYGADWGDINGGNLSDNFDYNDVGFFSFVGRTIKGVIKTGKELVENWKGNTPSLPSFFWLQHHYGCYPFETEIIFVKTETISL